MKAETDFAAAYILRGLLLNVQDRRNQHLGMGIGITAVTLDVLALSLPFLVQA